MSGTDFHDDYRQKDVKSSSNRSFGFVFAQALVLLGIEHHPNRQKDWDILSSWATSRSRAELSALVTP